MALNFSAHLSLLFTECGLLVARYGAAAQAGFTAVETTFPADTSVEELVAAKESSGVQQVLINAPVGKQPWGLPFGMCVPRGGGGVKS